MALLGFLQVNSAIKGTRHNITKRTKSLLLGGLNASSVKSRTLGRPSKHVHAEPPILGMQGWGRLENMWVGSGSILEL